MKRIMFGFAVLVAVFGAAVLVGGTAAADNFVVLTPILGEVLEPGDGAVIQWAEEAPIGEAWVPPSVTISLEQGGNTVLQIGTVNSPTISTIWSVPGGLSGTYQIRVEKIGTGESALSPEFSIQAERFTPQTFGEFFGDTGRVRWTHATNTTLTWNPTTAGQAIEYHIIAPDGLRAYRAVTVSDTSTGSVTFSVPETLVPGEYYIEVRNLGATPLPCPGGENDGHCDPEALRYPFIHRTGTILDVYGNPGLYPDGTVVREADAKEVWILKILPNGRKFRRHVISAAMADWYGHWGDFWSSVITVPPGTIADYELSAWIRLPLSADPKTWRVYEVNADMTKHWITCPEFDDCRQAWFEHGGEEAGIYTVNQTEVNAYTTGTNVFVQSNEFEHAHDEPVGP